MLDQVKSQRLRAATDYASNSSEPININILSREKDGRHDASSVRFTNAGHQTAADSQLPGLTSTTSNRSDVLSKFLAQQQMRLDFGHSSLYAKVKDGEDLGLPFDATPLEPNGDDLIAVDAVVRAHDEIIYKLSYIMNEIGFDQRLIRTMDKGDLAKTPSRVHTLQRRLN